MSKAFYFDSYALVEIAKGSKNYEKYKTDIKIVLNKLNIMEFCYFLTREKRSVEVKERFSQLSKFHVDFPDEVYEEAIELKYEYKKRKLSYTDCLGYCMAKFMKIRFLTGDEKFEDLPNVEYVKG